MGDYADMVLDGLIDEESGEYIGDINADRFGTEAPGFPVSYEREHREEKKKRRGGTIMVTLPAGTKAVCPECGARVMAIGLMQHLGDKHNLKLTF